MVHPGEVNWKTVVSASPLPGVAIQVPLKRRKESRQGETDGKKCELKKMAKEIRCSGVKMVEWSIVCFNLAPDVKKPYKIKIPCGWSIGGEYDLCRRKILWIQYPHWICSQYKRVGTSLDESSSHYTQRKSNLRLNFGGSEYF